MELSIFLPVCTSPTSRSSPESPDFTSVTTQSTSLSPAPPASHHWSSLDRNTVPFPTPPNTHKIVLFQGAVPYASLQDVFTQKGLQAQNALKLSWSRLNSEAGAGLNGQPLFFGNRYRCGQSLPPNSSSSPSSNSKDRTEFIMMRGPKGKGQCQVAISNLLKSSPVQGDVRSDSSSGDQSAEDRSRGLKSLFGDRFKMMAGAVKSLVGGSSTDGRGLRTDDHGTTDGLMGSITYVNVAWQSIVNDLLDYARKLPPL